MTILLVSCLALSALAAPTPNPSGAERRQVDRWVRDWFQRSGGEPFSFVYDGKPSAELLKTWRAQRSSQRLDALRTRRTQTYRDPATGLVVRCEAVVYSDFPTVEWTVYLRNDGTRDTPIIEDIRSLDVGERRPPCADFVLHHWTGSPATANDYAPHEKPLGPNENAHIATAGGRGTNSDMPYFNVEWAGGGAIAAIGWPGQWSADFTRDGADGLRMRGGQELTHLVLHPGEEIRTPLAVIQAYIGDAIYAQNVWRRWMIAHNLPRPGGKLVPPSLMMCTSDFYPGMQSTAEGEKRYIDAYVNGGVKLDYWWIDAGWYPCDGPGWPKVGTWEPDPKRYPKGIREIADYVHGKGMKLVVWFEPERVAKGTWIAQNHPEWVLGGAKGGLLNLGDPQAHTWLTEHIDRIIVEQGIDLYRQDFNMDPLGYWRANDAPDRQGMTEIRHVEGYLAYWDELRRRHPNMPIDSCASGGRRNDLETLRRALPLLRSDYRFEPIGTQGHTYGISSWIPYYGTGVMDASDYVVRSHWCPWLGIGRDKPEQPGLDWTTYHRYVSQWRSQADCFLGDYYPLTPYSLDSKAWIAWQFDLPENRRGMVQAFRRPDCADDTIRLKLRGLEPNSRYAVTNLDTHEVSQAAGSELMDAGMEVRSPGKPGAVVLSYRRM